MWKRNKKHRWKRLLSAILAAAVTITSIPLTEVQAANALPAVGLEFYDYSRMESIMQDGKETAYRNNSSGLSKDSTLVYPMSFGEMVYLQFALPYNTFYTMKVLDENGTDLGYMYAKFYTEHADGSVETGYTTRGKSMDAIKLELKNFVYEMPYAAATNFFGIGLTGEVLPYRTLAEYYDFYGIEAPSVLENTLAPEETPSIEEIPAVEPPAVEAPPEEEAPEEAVKTPTEITEAEEGQETPDTEASDMEDVPAEEGSDKLEEPEVQTPEGGETIPEEAPSPVEEDSAEEQPKAVEPETSVEEDAPEGDAPEGDAPAEEGTPTASLFGKLLSAAEEFKETLFAPMIVEAASLNPEAAPGADEKKEPENTPSEDGGMNAEQEEALSEDTVPEEETNSELPDGWVSEDELPEDFYIHRDFRISLLSGTDGETNANILHNFVVWKGEICDAAGGNIQYLQPGNYTIRIQSKAQSLEPVDLPFTISGSGEDGALTPEDVLAAVFRDMIFFPGFASGYPTLKMCTGGDPIDLLSGSLNWTYTDLTLDGKNPLTFTRTYISSMHELDDSGLGNGWSHNYDYRAETFDGNVDIFLPNGGHIYFYYEYDGSYKTNKGNAWHLESAGDGYVMSHDNGQVIYFNADGNATCIEEPNGNVVNMSYSDGKLANVNNASGSFRFAYSGDHISTVTDSAGRTLALSYAGGDLISVQNPDGDSFRYAYDDGHCMTEITDLNGNLVLQNTYDENHKVIEQRMPDRGLMTMEYDPDNRTNTYREEGGDTQTVTYDDRFRITSFTDDAGTETYAYDENNRLISETDRNGGTTTYEYEGEYTYPSVTNHPNGTRTEYTYTSLGMVGKTVQKDGTVLTSAYDSVGNLTSTTDAKGLLC